MLIRLEGEFWNHVQEGIPPAIDGSEASAKFLNQRFPDSVPKSKIDLPGDAVFLIRRYEAACEQLKQAEEQKLETENRLKEMLGEHEMGTAENHVITWKSITQERLDSKALKEDRPSLFKKYANKTSYRRFSIKAAS